MLTGRQVFTADSVLQMVARHIQMAPEPPSRYSPFPLSPELEEIVFACLAKRPSDRPASAWELADRLARCVVESPWTREEARLWWETRLQPEPAVSLAL